MFRPAFRSRSAAASIRARSWTRWEPRRCWGRATCCTCRPGRAFRPGCTALSCPTPRCTASSSGSSRWARRTMSRACWMRRTSCPARARRAALRPARPIRCTTRRWRSWCATGAPRFPWCSGIFGSATTALRACWRTWSGRAWCPRCNPTGTARSWCRHGARRDPPSRLRRFGGQALRSAAREGGQAWFVARAAAGLQPAGGVGRFAAAVARFPDADAERARRLLGNLLWQRPGLARSPAKARELRVRPSRPFPLDLHQPLSADDRQRRLQADRVRPGLEPGHDQEAQGRDSRLAGLDPVRLQRVRARLPGEQRRRARRPGVDPGNAQVAGFLVRADPDRLSRRAAGGDGAGRQFRTDHGAALLRAAAQPENRSGPLSFRSTQRGGRAGRPVNDLFESARPASGPGAAAPLAERMRPRRFEDVIGQSHLLGPGKPLRIAFESRHPHSMILWGPPGVGKTTLARLMADAFGLEFIAISAVLGGVKDIRDAVERAQATLARSGRPTVVFVDEVHRFNKSQQDAFLPHVESGLFVFVGATTENPSFEVNSALLSRAAVYVLKSLDASELTELLDRAQGELGGLTFTDEARDALIGSADGDGRKLLNNLEIVARAAAQQKSTNIDGALLGSALAENLRRFDKGGDAFYDQISALHKSVRGSNPDATLYWFCRMLDGGTDPLYIARRAIRMASEDVGLADPRALTMALEAAQAYERLGSPEGELALAQAIVYLAVAPKSNAVYVAFGQVRPPGTR